MVFPIPQGTPAPRILPRGISLRRAGEDDEIAAFEVMRRSMGYEMTWAHHAAVRQHLRNSPDSSFWLAEESHRFSKPRAVGYARSIVREGVWNLTEFFVLQTHHRQGIGSGLLANCLEDAAGFGADTHLVLASRHPSADALYVRQAGCIPRLPMFLLSGPRGNLRADPYYRVPVEDTVLPHSAPASYDAGGVVRAENAPILRAEPLNLTPEISAALDSLDREIVGFARAPEHVHWNLEMGGETGAARLFRRILPDGSSGEIAGYAYFGAHASGPALATDPADLPRMLAHIMGVSNQLTRATDGVEFLGSGDPYIAIAGTNETVLRWLLDCGWQIVFQYLFMSSRPLGRPDRYVCHNPLYVL